MVTTFDLALRDGRTLRVYDTADAEPDANLTIFWQHGTPNVGAPPAPLFAKAATLRIRWVSHDRPGYGSSSPKPGRDIASAAADVTEMADALDIGRFAVMGHSGGGTTALGCAASLRGRVSAVVCVAGLAPFDAKGLDWYAGMGAAGEAELRAAARGRTALADHLASSDFDPRQFTPADHESLSGTWSWLADVAGQALQGGASGMIDDDLSYVMRWGCRPEQIRPPVLLLHGRQDRIAPYTHAEWLAHHIPSSELWLSPHHGHISILEESPAALEWLAEQEP